MDTESIKALIKKITENEDLQEQVAALPLDDMDTAVTRGCKIAQDAGFEMSDLEVRALLEEFTGERELSDEELAQVAGGIANCPTPKQYSY